MAQKITVKEVRGPLGKGEKKFFSIKDDKGGEFTSFDTKLANIKPGSVLEAEVEVSGQYINLKEWKVISEPSPEAPSSTTYRRDTEGIEFEYRLKAHLQEIERKSIEAQSAYRGIMELAAQELPKEISGKFGEVFDLALDWAKARLGVTPTKPIPSLERTKSTRSPVKEETDDNLFEEAVETAPQVDSVDPDWLKETLTIIHWSESTAKSWLRSQFKLYPELSLKAYLDLSLNEVLNSLEKNQLKVFVEHIKLMRESAGE